MAVEGGFKGLDESARYPAPPAKLSLMAAAESMDDCGHVLQLQYREVLLELALCIGRPDVKKLQRGNSSQILSQQSSREVFECNRDRGAH